MVGNELNLIVFFKNNFTRRVCQLYPSYNSLFNSIFFCAFYALQHWIKLTVNRSAALGNPPRPPFFNMETNGDRRTIGSP